MYQVGISAAFLAVAAVYAAPSLVAALKGRRRWLTVVFVNLVLGWTVVGWVVAWAIALEFKRRPLRRKRPAETQFEVPAEPKVPGTGRLPDEPPEVRDDAYADWLDHNGGGNLDNAPTTDRQTPNALR